MNELTRILEHNERVLWQDRPQFWPFVLGGFVGALLGGFLMVMGLFMFFIAKTIGNSLLFLVPHFWIGVALFIGTPLYKLLVYKHTYYAITNKRVLIQTGFIGRDFRIIDFDKITNAEVNMGVLDIIFGRRSGSILLSSAGTFISGKHGLQAVPYRLSNIADPYGVFKFFKKVSHDVKTDIAYPNEIRPTINRGYRTELKTKEAIPEAHKR